MISINKHKTFLDWDKWLWKTGIDNGICVIVSINNIVIGSRFTSCISSKVNWIMTPLDMIFCRFSGLLTVDIKFSSTTCITGKGCISTCCLLISSSKIQGLSWKYWNKYGEHLHRVNCLIEDTNFVSLICVCCSNASCSNVKIFKNIGIFIPSPRISCLIKIGDALEKQWLIGFFSPNYFFSYPPLMSGQLPKLGTGAKATLAQHMENSRIRIMVLYFNFYLKSWYYWRGKLNQN